MTASEPFADGSQTGDDDPPVPDERPSPERDELSLPGDVLTTEEFATALAFLLRNAARSDVAAPRTVDVAGRSGSTARMVEITRIDRPR